MQLYKELDQFNGVLIENKVNINSLLSVIFNKLVDKIHFIYVYIEYVGMNEIG